MSEQTQQRPRRAIWLLWIVLLQVLFLGGIAGSYYAVDWFGEEIKLKTVPVDPRDMLYGDYVTLSYEVSQLSPALWKGEGELPKQGSRVFVQLKPENGLYVASGIYSDKPAAIPGEAVLKGRVSYSWNEMIRVEYGIEQYYVPEGTGKELEEKARNMIVAVKIASWGQAKIAGLEY
ncbi:MULTISPECIES: GDYXXLXY domain-containing protein [Paenibacillus]|uniref:GDYXXLXY domain-containing protein n=1 Tax=Paenibacillus radicis (ex Xue et al. 2023) TaxID=2972489 RepID=A0ABT1YPD6_9BACL|nr:GDYXXLXY domain-containing protein [Paenibacillus radicis (ex Xue et al. 2023)]MCR8634138.1 GDYXXLXY domain-containing protein [Paenibacillus radicis (ex Xue et al. 2023)]